MDMKNSAYRSMHLAKLNKTKNKNGRLRQWIEEEWLNLNALYEKNIELPCGKKYKNQKQPTVCRPKKKINKNTPEPLAYNLTKDKVKKAIKIKEKGDRINWKKL